MLTTWTHRAWRAALLKSLASLREGQITFREPDGEAGHRCHSVGDPEADLQVTVDVHAPRFYRRLVCGGGLAAAQALMDGDWTSDDLVSLVRIFTRNLQVSDSLNRGTAAVRTAIARWTHWLRRNTPVRARQNIRAHYDLGNDFYALFLDRTMSYSCGLFPTPDATLEQASTAKMDRVCRRLRLGPNDHLLEIGTGWGGLAIHAARHFGCRVTTTTISAEQRRFAIARIREAGLETRITVLGDDYRNLAGSYSKLVSIEMIEAVGHQYFDCFFATCRRLLRDDGLMLLQSIVIADDRYENHIRGVDFIRESVFPGGCLPSISVLSRTAAEAARLRVLELNDFGPHYARTLHAWRERFVNNLEAVREGGHSASFIRMWHYYLCYCEAAFREHQVSVVQLLLAPPGFHTGPHLAEGDPVRLAALARPPREPAAGPHFATQTHLEMAGE